MKNWKTG